MSEAREKDYILTRLTEHIPPHAINGLSKHADELESDGHIEISSSENGFIIRALLADKGARFLDNGGYTKSQRRKLTQKLWYGFWFVMGVAATKITDRLIDIVFPLQNLPRNISSRHL